MKIIVLGGSGGIGRVIVDDLFYNYKDSKITIAERNLEKATEYAKSFKSDRVKAVQVDVKDIKNTAKIMKGNDVAINSVIYYLNLQVMKACLEADVNYVDLGGLFHMTRKQLKMNRQFKRKSLIAILGCGSTPGITNVMAAYGARFFDRIDEIHISFGDADFTKYNQPFVIPYTMYTLFDEFMLKPALYTKGKLKMVEPISGEKILEFPKPVGKITGFYTLHSELATFPSSFKDKGIKKCSFRVTFPKDFIDKIRFLIDIGFASEKEIKINSIELKPKDFTAKVMNQWLPKAGTKIKDLEYLRVEIVGIKNKKTIKKDLYCFNKSYKNFPAGSYNTGVAPSIIAQMIAKGEIKKKGVLAPELCIDPESFFKELEKRKIKTIDGIYESKNNKSLIF